MVMNKIVAHRELLLPMIQFATELMMIAMAQLMKKRLQSAFRRFRKTLTLLEVRVRLQLQFQLVHALGWQQLKIFGSRFYLAEVELPMESSYTMFCQIQIKLKERE